MGHKKRNSRRRGFVSFDLKRLKQQWLNSDQNHHGLSDFSLIRAVTYLEVFTRSQVAALVDHAKQYTDRAVELSKHFKMDSATVQDVQGRVITLGDIVAHSIPVNTFHQIISHFETILGVKLRPLLVDAVDRWETEIEKKPSEPIIPDYDRMAERLTRLFEVRHVLCHEMPSNAVYSSGEVLEFLDEAERFARAMEEILTFEKYGRVPLTQTDMNIDAHETLKKKQEELDHLLSSIRDRVSKSDERVSSFRHPSVDRTWLQSFNDAEDKWLAYRNAQCDFEVFMSQGGSILPLLWATRATQLTQERIEQLQTWVKEESERSVF